MQLQDRLLAELVRVVRRDGRVVGSDSVASEELEALHDDDTYNPIQPTGLHERLTTAGLRNVEIDTNHFAFRLCGCAR